MKVLTYRSYKGHFKQYTEIYGSIAVNRRQIKLFIKDKVVPEDDILINYSKSASHNHILY